MNRLVVTLALSAFAFGASAQTLAPDAAAQTQNTPADVTVVTGDKDKEKINDRYCLRETGSHIAGKHKKSCISSANGTAYNRDDIDRTGATDLAEALRRLSPSVSIQHN